MINKWILNNFKSIESREELEFRPLTIFTGANSSGKSTILQSILLISQTLQSPIVSRSIVLNGGIKKFGSYSDIVNRRQWSKDLTVGFEISDEMYSTKRFYTPWMDDVKNLSCEFVVGAKKEDDLQPYLKELVLKCNDDDNHKSKLSLKRNNGPSEKVKEIVSSLKEDAVAPEELEYDVEYKMDEGFSHVRTDERVKKYYMGSPLTHFFPNYLTYAIDKKELFMERLDRHVPFGVSLRYRGYMDNGDYQEIGENMGEKGKQLAEELHSRINDFKYKKNKTAFEKAYKRYLDTNQIDYLLEMYSECDPQSPEMKKCFESLKRVISEMKPIYGIDRTPSHFIPGVDFTKEFFCEHIWYLGPLREEPKALYPLESDGSMNTVGFKGENTAAVLDYNRLQKIDYIPTSSLEKIGDAKLKPKRGTLEKVVKEWLVYLGVASDIDTDDRGKIGHIMQISNDLNIKQDLTHVGVGVSQVLPILVMSLLAEKGDVIILEQPELHLHPKVQTRLADFFVSMNALGKQCLIETHSEYLINRLRYHVAKSETTKVADDTMIYFVTKEGMHSVYNPVTINRYGVIPDWPDGFFDESEKIASDVLKAGVEKRRRERQTEKQVKGC